MANKQVREDQDIDLRLLPRNVTFKKDVEPVRRQREEKTSLHVALSNIIVRR